MRPPNHDINIFLVKVQEPAHLDYFDNVSLIKRALKSFKKVLCIGKEWVLRHSEI